MNGIHSILVHVDANARAELRLRVALRLARASQAHLTALYAVSSAAYSMPMAVAEAASSMAPLLANIDRERFDAAHAMFESVVSQAGAGTSRPAWADAGRGPSIAAVAGRALLADLVVLGQHDPSDPVQLPDADLVADTLISSGTPALVLPYAGRFDPEVLAGNGPVVALAWKPTRESARAARAALPWLKRAREVHLAVESATSGDENLPGVSDLQRWLEWHGVRAPVEHHAIGRNNAGELLLSLAADVSADLLAMGCYGHSRTRELVLGGASRTVLESMTVPTLLAH
jgi:nucleotide-binding universal stress UspA family protein